MKKKFLLLGVLAAILSWSAASGVSATTEGVSSNSSSQVSSITLTGEGSSISWSTAGQSSMGFKIVWSKNENPTYPLRDGDQYHYYSEPTRERDVLTAFSGNGTYYVRVCEYLGGKCGKYSNQISVVLGDAKVVSENSTASSKVSAIALRAASNGGGVVEWTTTGYSAMGFKVVWSKSENPTYPTRDGDMYHYYSEPTKARDVLTAFAGAGTYYVRVCEYLGGKCGLYSNQVAVELSGMESGKTTEVKPSKVESIVLTGEGNNIKWSVAGYSAQGYKVVWSKASGPTYPTRDGDQYHFRSADASTDWLNAFAGNGDYYVRVCEYLGGKCGVYSNEIKVSLTGATEKGAVQIGEIREATQDLYQNKMDELLKQINELKSIVKEQAVQITHLMRLQEGLSQAISSATETAIKNFIAYGVDKNTKALGEGERAAVMYSYKAAFDKLPATEEELEDAIKIANGRWPSIVSDEAEAQAKAQFKKIYLRDADMNNANDAAAVKVMAYGLRQKAENRNLNSERSGLRIFKSIFGRLPQSTEDWNALQAITYSGATR